MKCDHTKLLDVGSVTWCRECGAVRANAYVDWQLPESEQHAVRLAEMCPICEFGNPKPVEEKDGYKIWRWTCGHWIDSRTADWVRKEKEEGRL